MEMRLVEREAFCVCGYAVETTLAQNDKDVAALCRDFFENGREAALLSLKGSTKGYYGVSWYTQGQERYCYLLGIEVGPESTAPANAVVKSLPQTTYAVAGFSKGEDIIKAWTDFFYEEIPHAGLSVNAQPNVYFEYYPGAVDDAYELWVPVIKTQG